MSDVTRWQFFRFSARISTCVSRLERPDKCNMYARRSSLARGIPARFLRSRGKKEIIRGRGEREENESGGRVRFLSATPPMWIRRDLLTSGFNDLALFSITALPRRSKKVQFLRAAPTRRARHPSIFYLTEEKSWIQRSTCSFVIGVVPLPSHGAVDDATRVPEYSFGYIRVGKFRD